MTNVMPALGTNSTITLDTVLLELETWRSKKTSIGGKMPAELWRKIIFLGEKHGATKVRSLFGLSKAQYEGKLNELNDNTGNRDLPPNIDFEEIKPQRSPHPAATERYHMPDLPATNTVVVELFRADGKLMKIHSTTHRLKELLDAFYGGI